MCRVPTATSLTRPVVLEDLEALGDCGSADRQPLRNLADGARLVDEAFENGPTGGIAESGPHVGWSVSGYER